MKNKIMGLLTLTIILSVFAHNPTYAYKVIQNATWGIKLPAKINSVSSAIEVNATIDRFYAPVFVSNLDCGEYTRTYPLKSSEGVTYIRKRSRTIKISDEPTVYLKKLFKENEGNIYFKAYGLGLFGYYVGEFFIGNQSVSKHLIEKGYCKYVN